MNEALMLHGISILFVDDRYEITRDYARYAEELGAKAIYCNTIERAYSVLQTRGSEQPLDFVVLDLHMRLPDPLPEGLKKYGGIFQESSMAEKRSLNAGQILGMYINDNLPMLQFIYLSAVAAHYEILAGGEPKGEPKCFDRYETSPRQLAQEIAKRVPSRAS